MLEGGHDVRSGDFWGSGLLMGHVLGFCEDEAKLRYVVGPTALCVALGGTSAVNEPNKGPAALLPQPGETSLSRWPLASIKGHKPISHPRRYPPSTGTVVGTGTYDCWPPSAGPGQLCGAGCWLLDAHRVHPDGAQTGKRRPRDGWDSQPVRTNKTD